MSRTFAKKYCTIATIFQFIRLMRYEPENFKNFWKVFCYVGWHNRH